jgi:hypothetical protein
MMKQWNRQNPGGEEEKAEQTLVDLITDDVPKAVLIVNAEISCIAELRFSFFRYQSDLSVLQKLNNEFFFSIAI